MPAANDHGRNKYLSLVLGTIILCVPALLNKFPFVYSDTATYLLVGFTEAISYIRTLTYGVFLRHVSMKESFWFVVIAQSLLVTWYIQLFAKTFFKNRHAFFDVGIIGLLTLTTSIGICTGMLMPDFTTPLLFLASALFLYGSSLSKATQIINVVLSWFFLTVHHSHALIMLPALLGLVVVTVYLRKKSSWEPTRKMVWFALLITIGYLSIPTLHYLKKGEFVASKSTNVFLVSRFNQMGLLTSYLNESCGEGEFTLCAYRDSIPDSFLWGPNTPLNKDGGWAANNENYRPLVYDFFARPKYLKRFAIKSLETATQQFVTFNTVLISPFSRGEWPQDVFEQQMPHTVAQFESSKQNRKQWSNKAIDLSQNVLVFTSAIFLIWFFWYQRRCAVDPAHRQIAALLLFFLLANAFICGGISMIAPRFQSRVIWLVPFFTVGLLVHYKLFHRNRLG